MNPATHRDRLRQLILDLQQDMAGYRTLKTLLEHQRDLLIAHDARQLAELNPQQVQLMDSLNARAARRVQLLAELGCKADEKGMQSLIRRLPPALAENVTLIWQQLQQLLLACKAQNDSNGQLLSGQVELIRSLLQRPAAYPASAC